MDMKENRSIGSLLLLPCLCGLLATGLYLNTLGAGFAYDDSRAIQKNPDLLPETPLINLAYDDFWGTPLTHSGSHKSYRPLCVLTYRFNYLIAGLDPWGYHLGNILCHAITTAMFTALAQWIFAGSCIGDETYQNGNGDSHSTHTSKTSSSHVAVSLEPRNIGSTVAGLLFASHPVHTEAVAGIVGRADVLSCLLFLLTFVTYTRYVAVRNRAARGRRWLLLATVGVLSAAAMLTKEHAVTVLAVCAVYDVIVVHRTNPQDFITLALFTKPRYRPLLEGLSLLTLIGSALLGVRLYCQGNKPPEFAPSDNPAADSNSLLTRLLTFNFLPAANVWLLLCPHTLSFDWSMEAVPLVESFFDVRILATLSLYSVLAYIAVWIINQVGDDNHISGRSNDFVEFLTWSNNKMDGNYYRNENNNDLPKVYQNGKGCNSLNNGNTPSDTLTPQQAANNWAGFRYVDIVTISLAILVFPFIPASNLFFYVGFVLAERVLYTPSMGLCLLVGAGMQLLYFRLSRYRHVIVAAFFLLLITFSGKTILRNLDWQTEERLYESGLRVNPPKAWGNLANIYNDKQEVERAEEAYRNALYYRPNMADVHYNLGILLQNQNRDREAIESYNKAIHFRPKLSVAHLNLGILTAQLGDTEAAKRIYVHCANLDTSGLKDPRLHDSTKISCIFNHGRLLMDEGKLEESVEKLREAIDRKPDHYAPQSLYNMLGEAYYKLTQYSEAEHWYTQALSSKPDHVPAHLTMSKLELAQKRYKQAEEWLMKAKQIEPDSYYIDNHIAQLFAATGRHEEAMALLDSILSHVMDDFDAVYSAASTYREGGKKDKAEALYIAATKIRPKEAAAWMNLGAMYHINMKYDKAEEAYLTALQLRPGDKITLDNLQRLRNLQTKLRS